MNKEVVSLNSSEKETPQETKNPFRLFAFISGKNLKIIVLIIIFIVALVVFLKLSGEKSSSKTGSVSSSIILFALLTAELVCLFAYRKKSLNNKQTI